MKEEMEEQKEEEEEKEGEIAYKREWVGRRYMKDVREERFSNRYLNYARLKMLSIN